MLKTSAFTLAALLLAGSSLAQTTIEVPISLATDDTELRDASGVLGVDFDSSDLEVGQDGNRPTRIGLRFQNVNLPANAVVSNAYIQFTGDAGDAGAEAGVPVVVIRGEANVNPVTYINDVTDIPGRATTTAEVTWTATAQFTADTATTAERTPNLSAIVTEIISLPGWAAGNAMAFQIFPSAAGERTAHSFENSASNSAWVARLVITYTTPAPLAANDWALYE